MADMGAKVNVMGCKMGVPTWFMEELPAMLTARLDWLSKIGCPTEPPPIMATWVRDWGMLAERWAGDMGGGIA